MSRQGSPLANESVTLPHLVDGNSDSELSDVPTNIELPASNSRSDDADVASRSVKKAKKRRSARNSDSWPTTKKRRVAATETDTNSETDYDEDELDLLGLQELDIDTHEVSRFESLPRELLQKISTDVATDQDLVNLIATCRRLATSINPPNSGTWKARFLAAYDYPEISASVEYCWVYKERSFVLRNFLNCHRVDLRTSIQLQVLKEMVLESYHVPASRVSAATSRNFQADEHSTKAEWLRIFLSSPLFNTFCYRYGESQMLFDSLQLTFSYLLLSPAHPMAHAIETSRDNYDIEKVYNWNQEFTTVCTLQTEQSYAAARRSESWRQMAYEPLFSPWPTYKLDLHGLLHVRNFWHRHLLDDGHELHDKTGFGESTYSTMANGLADLGHVPGPWKTRLRQCTTRSHGARAGKWIGHYSCIHGPWPRTRKDLADRESCAEDWEKVDPLTLDFDVKESNVTTWPLIFRDIPAIKRTTPSHVNDPTIAYIRGIAPFLEIATLLGQKQTPSCPKAKADKGNATHPRNVKYHPYKALRIRGFMHLLASPESDYQHVGHIMDPEIPVPGFSRIFFVLYKPTSRYLVQVLEHNMGDFGSPWTVHVGQQLQNQQVTVNVPTDTGNANEADDVMLDVGVGAATANVPIQAVVDGNALAHDPAQAEKILRTYLDDLLDGEHDVDVWDNGRRVLEKNKDGIWDFATKKVKNFPIESMTREVINNMEEAYYDTKFLNWEDIEYAYGYEGVVTPGGKVMMGRWWRMGLNGVGINDGYEIDCEGMGVKVVNGESFVPNPDVEWHGETDWVTVEGMRKKSKGLERGPFVFWTSDSLAK